ncbi:MULTISPECIES: ABC transporter permease [Desulfitobacterium]|uniref:ABC-type spermidine/putrescine transport system, permease component II n=2 Tax=Desulfitobacterium dehalogenans TaxID=36854 RepID=I4A910_DESDJ|nr:MULTISPECIES: ABC transporter permease [Desulfitobacterium]AFM00445.1 ABC-type spermidine/putrescine transport system, permease component II [Desulfitobacterium dehalogenans ATCC 51507]HHY26596.1 ABC transporter permease [Desulfitobacterium dehalogenans]
MKSFLMKSYTFLIFFFLYAPILILMIFSFNDSKSRGNWDGFTLKWYIELFRDSQIASALYYTLVIAILASLIATIIGTLAAIGINNMHGLPKVMTLNVTYLPMLSPDIVMGISLMLLFIFIKFKLGFMTMLFAHITFNLPFVIFSVLPKLRQLNDDTYDAALDLGATPLEAYKKVILPQISPGIVTGFLLAFTMSIDDFVVSFFTTGSGVSNLAITIYSMARRGINPKINALLTLMFIFIMVTLVFVNYRMAKDKGNEKRDMY